MGLITKKEAARILGRSERAIDEWIAQGVLKTHLVKQTRYIDGDTVDALKDTEADITHAMQERQKALDAIKEETSALRQRENFTKWSVREAIMAFVAALDVLNDVEKRVFVGVMEGCSYESIGEDFCVTRERVRQIFYKAFRRVSASIKSYRRMLNETIELRRLRDEVKEKDRELQQLRKMLNVSEPDMEMCKLLSTELVDMNLSVRTINCLKSAGVCTVGELVQCNKLELLKIRNFGKKSLWELDDLLDRLGLEWCDGVRGGIET